MPTDFRELSFGFSSESGAIQVQRDTARFGSNVNRASAALKAFDIHFDNDEHPVLRELVAITTFPPDGPNVTVDVNFLLRDNSGNIDDPYSGSVTIVVIADVA